MSNEFAVDVIKSMRFSGEAKDSRGELMDYVSVELLQAVVVCLCDFFYRCCPCAVMTRCMCFVLCMYIPQPLPL